MCELFGFHSPRAQDVRGFLTEFYSHSEQYVGRALRDFAKRDEVVVATKFLPRTPQEIAASVNGGGIWFGSGDERQMGSHITIYGGEIAAYGGEYGAGIGSGDESGGDNGYIDIYGGMVWAVGDFEAAGIGGGNEGNGRNITICGISSPAHFTGWKRTSPNWRTSSVTAALTPRASILSPPETSTAEGWIICGW